MTHQALPSFDAEYARVLKAAESAQALAHDREAMINAANAALDAAGVARDLPLAGERDAALVGERDQIEAATIERLRQCALALIAMPDDATDAMVMATLDSLPSDFRAMFSAGVDVFRELSTGYDVLSRQLAELTHLVGAETPIAALDLATTWHAEKAYLMECLREVISDAARYREALQDLYDAQLPCGGNESAMQRAAAALFP